MISIVITGGCGFIGHHFVEHFLRNTDWKIIVLDKLSYAANGFDRLRDIKCFNHDRVHLFPINLTLPLSSGIKQEIGSVDYIINLASESHVDNSIAEPVTFIRNNVDLVINLLEWARGIPGLQRFLQFSTDEVYGTAPQDRNYKEGDRFNAGNPYSASKAAQEVIATAYANSYRIPVTITNTMNVFGERQHPEKFVPMVISKVLSGEKVMIHADETKTRAGTRFYIHARNVVAAIHFILSETNETTDKTDAGRGKFHIVGEREIDNLSLAQMIAGFVGKELNYEMVDFHSSRPGHDLRYALDGGKMRGLGWNPPVSIENSLKKTVEWYMDRPEWLKKVAVN